jgi:hypothetical protein
VTLLSMAAPVIFSLLALLRRESVASVQSARVVAARFGMALQLQLLEEGRPLTLHATALAVRPKKLRFGMLLTCAVGCRRWPLRLRILRLCTACQDPGLCGICRGMKGGLPPCSCLLIRDCIWAVGAQEQAF